MICPVIDHQNGNLQKLTRLRQPHTDVSKLAKLMEALDIPSLNQLWLTIFLNTSYLCRDTKVQRTLYVNFASFLQTVMGSMWPRI